MMLVYCSVHETDVRAIHKYRFMFQSTVTISSFSRATLACFISCAPVISLPQTLAL